MSLSTPDLMEPKAAEGLFAKNKAAYNPAKVFAPPFAGNKTTDGPVTIGIDSFHRRD
jgi:hypothetical protein